MHNSPRCVASLPPTLSLKARRRYIWFSWEFARVSYTSLVLLRSCLLRRAFLNSFAAHRKSENGRKGPVKRLPLFSYFSPPRGRTPVALHTPLGDSGCVGPWPARRTLTLTGRRRAFIDSPSGIIIKRSPGAASKTPTHHRRRKNAY